ncbi:MAG: hypothetical protein JST00_45425 [Deltaproteobacteria bacterium]|nr:hypothetical protein [Deltaproteobacteria bacterium]
MQAPDKHWWEGGTPSPPAADAMAMAPLIKPFAAFGAAAGLFAILAIGSFRASARDVSPFAPMIATAIVGAVAGAVLRGWRRLHLPAASTEEVRWGVATVSTVAGCVSGGLVGTITWGADGFTRCAFGGAFVGLVFAPSCMVVFEAAKRAGRGRHGSLVAATDRRTVVSTVLGGIAFAGATQVPMILTANNSNELDPLFQVGLSFAATLGAVIGIVVLQRRDRATRAALDGFEKDAAWLDRVDDTEGRELPPGAVDLGIGGDSWTRTTDANYRSSGKSDVLVKGSIADATAAFDECARRRHRSLIVAACSLTAVVTTFALRLGMFL